MTKKDKSQPTEMDKLLTALAQRGVTLDGRPMTAESVTGYVLSVLNQMQELAITIKVLKRM